MGAVRTFCCACVAATSLAACAPSLTAEEVESKLKTATASVLATDPTTVTIANIQSTQTKRVWQARAGGKIFDCDADRSFALPACAEASGGAPT
jgi:hypothetical protein